MTKPFSFVELMARVRAVSRRGPVPRLPKFQTADLALDSSTHEVFRGGKPIPLTKKRVPASGITPAQRRARGARREVIPPKPSGEPRNLSRATRSERFPSSFCRNKVDRGHDVKLIHLHGARVRVYRLCEGEE